MAPDATTAEATNKDTSNLLESSQSEEDREMILSSDSHSSSVDDDGKAGDAVSLSTCSMSTNPTPDNPLYAAAARVEKVKMEEMIQRTRQLALKDAEGNDREGIREIRKDIDHLGNAQEFPRNVVTTTGVLHEDFHKSPEPVSPKRQSTIPTKVHTAEDRHRFHTLFQIREDRSNSNNASESLSNSNNAIVAEETSDYNVDASVVRTPLSIDRGGTETNHSPPISPIAAGSPVGPTASPIGASLLLRNRRSISTESLNSSNSSNNGGNWVPPPSPSLGTSRVTSSSPLFVPKYICTKITYAISQKVFDDSNDGFAVATWLGFWALFNVSCANYVLKPIMDSVVLQLGVENLPTLTSASTVLSFLSSVPIGWLFEAPDPKRRKVFKKIGMTRGETQGTSLALFYRFFALSIFSYAIGFQLVDLIQNYGILEWIFGSAASNPAQATESVCVGEEYTNGECPAFSEKDPSSQYDHILLAITGLVGTAWKSIPFLLKKWGQLMYVAFFLVVTLMTRHSTSLVWGVTTEAMEYEEIARKQYNRGQHQSLKKEMTHMQRLARITFGGTLGGIWGSVLASSLANILDLPGLLVVSAFLLEISAELSIELGRIMQQHWEEQQIYRSNQDLTSLDPSMKRSTSVGSMKRVASGNSLFASQQQNMKRVASGNSIHSSTRDSTCSLSSMGAANQDNSGQSMASEVVDDNTFLQRLQRGIAAILNSRLLMTIFTYNALFSSITTLLSFQRAELVANRKKDTTVSADTAFLANVNMVSSIVQFAMQFSGAGAAITQRCGLRGSLALMPLIRLGGLIWLCWWNKTTHGQPPNLILFLILDEFTKVINLAVAKPVRESLWRGMSSEARYEAKPIIDVLANRWGAGSASVCVHAFSWVLLVLGQSSTSESKDPVVFGLPPVLFLGSIVSAWWVGVSLDLGDQRIKCDRELEQKKNQ